MSRAVQIRKLLRRWGLDLVRKQIHSPDVLLHHGIDTVFDVGANAGQYALHLRKWGYRGRIVSFEPLSTEYGLLERSAASDPCWQAVNIGLGEYDGTAVINVSELSVYSSILRGLPELHTYDRRADAVRQEEIVLRRLDTVIDDYAAGSRNLFLKIDTQGYEQEVIRGASGSLGRFRGVQVEVSLAPLYQGEALLGDMLELMQEFGFSPVMLEPAAYDLDQKFVRQVDCMFFRRDGSTHDAR